jgi:hypothetical protein
MFAVQLVLRHQPSSHRQPSCDLLANSHRGYGTPINHTFLEALTTTALDKILWVRQPKQVADIFLLLLACLTTVSWPLPKWILRTVGSSASFFSFQDLYFSLSHPRAV